MTGPLLLEARDLQVDYPKPSRLWRAPQVSTALQQVSLSVDCDQSLAVVGESGSGKSTLARALLRLVPLVAGQVLLRGEDLAILSPVELQQRRRDLQMVFQDPYASLDPRMTVAEILAQPLRVFEPQLSAAQRLERCAAALQEVGLQPSHLSRYAHQFSGGQAQRIGIARALIARPAVLICDEPVSALDLPIRLQVLQLLAAQRAQRGLALVFIAHDLAAVRYLCERTLVLYAGRIMEQGPTSALFDAPRHPYTRTLLAATLWADPVKARQAAAVRRALSAPVPVAAVAEAAVGAQGCPWAPRCTLAQDLCWQQQPVLRQVGEVQVACHRAGEAL